MLMSLLLKFEGYPPAVVFALLLHASLLWFFLDHNMQSDDLVKIEPPSIAVNVAKESPQRLRRIEEIQKQTNEAERKRQADQQRQRQAEAERQKQAEAEKQKQADLQRQRQAEADRQKKAETERQQQAAAAERQRQAEAERLRVAEAERQKQAAERQRQEQAAIEARVNEQGQRVTDDLVAQYYAIIKQLISQNWVIPPNATNSMRAVVRFDTTPVGDILNARIVQFSGDANFDSSVLQAVQRAGDLQELRNLPSDVYERNFRRIDLVFQPEDLLR